ncbi:hypothetical protein IHQ68_19475 [Chelatococcus sambhunathii]|uniref:Penicillin-binding protein transpeptidase domain-containing protein n=1 Tax=Chelatococcus sambhunathii TaxID=363953 RepID=A0ABU1DL18_9HYPH|nr:penicillin-binding transpeptidase domain-containing protein [Chelatococcus sambhunathii]MDR4308808.1 hypothetical protein [Chelatococcus sambhunathii]
MLRSEGGTVVGARFVRLAAVGVALALSGESRADGPVDLPSAFRRAFDGVDACVAIRDVAPGAGSAVSDEAICGRRLPPCGTFELPATVIAIDRGVVPDASAPVKRNLPLQDDPSGGVSLREAFQRPIPWVYEEVARRIGSAAFDKALAGMRYGNAEVGGPVERIGTGDRSNGLTLSAPEQVEFLARLKRGELPTSSESQARTVEIMPVAKSGEASVAWKTGVCDSTGWVVGWVDRPQRSSVIFATAAHGADQKPEDLLARTRKLLAELALAPAE